MTTMTPQQIVAFGMFIVIPICIVAIVIVAYYFGNKE